MKSKIGSVAFEGPRWIIDFSLTMLMAVFIIAVVLTFANEKIDSHDLEAELLVKSLLYSDFCIVYSDGLQAYPGVISIEKMSQENLKSCFAKDSLGYKIKLLDDKGVV